ncbi:hypothetical protein DL95DRAFT_497186 [Leptodontidium sp. 2 PMI_412]|nr:hypothetical protein DL95DRAFT_497186 [Leptodontidium sp. 2 PMI_412]
MTKGMFVPKKAWRQNLPISPLEHCQLHRQAPRSPIPDPPTDTPSQPGYLFGKQFLIHSTTCIMNYGGLDGKRDWCHDVGYYEQVKNKVFPYPIERDKHASDLGWMSITCNNEVMKNEKGTCTAEQQWYAADAFNALLAYRTCWIGWYQWGDTRVIPRPTFVDGISKCFSQGDDRRCEIMNDPLCVGTVECRSDSSETSGPAGGGLAADTVDDQISGEMETAKKSFCPFSTSDKNNWLNIALDIVGIGFVGAGAPIWNHALAKIPKFLEHPAALSTIKDVTNGVVAGELSILKTTGAVEPAEDQSDALTQGKSMTTGLKTRWLQATNQSLFDAMNMILWTWSMSNTEVHPFILITEDIKKQLAGGTTLTSGCIDHDTSILLKSSDIPNIKTCIYGYAFYLASIPNGCGTCNKDCNPVNTGGEKSSYKANGAKNGYSSSASWFNFDFGSWGKYRADDVLGNAVSSLFLSVRRRRINWEKVD